MNLKSDMTTTAGRFKALDYDRDMLSMTSSDIYDPGQVSREQSYGY